MPTAALQTTSLVFLALSFVVSLSTWALARAYLRQVIHLSSGQTSDLVRKLSRAPAAERLRELQRQSSPDSIARRIADEAMPVDETQRAAAVDAVLADIALELESRALWPRAAIRISAGSGVLMMALAIVLRLEAFVAFILLLVGICSALVCMAIDRRAASMAVEIRGHVDALIDVLALRSPTAPRASISRSERRRRRRAGS